MKQKIIVFAASIILIFTGCKKDEIISTDSNGLYDPGTKPSIIFTFPANNAKGPFTSLYSTSYPYQNQPHFKIQFNKLMNYITLNSSNIKIDGFDKKVIFYLSYGYNSDYTGLYYFSIRDESYYAVPYEIGKTYKVTISPSAEDIHGNTLGREYSFSFTPEPSFRVISPVSATEINTETSQIGIYFNSTVSSSATSKIKISPAVKGTWYIGGDSLSVYFLPQENYSDNTTYTVTLQPDVSDKKGNILGQEYSLKFQRPAFKVISNNAENYSYFPLDYLLYVTFSSMLKETDISSLFSISPQVAGNAIVEGNSIRFKPNEPLELKTTYTVTISKNLQAKSGNTLPTPYTFSFTTEGFKVNQIFPYSGEKISRYSNFEIRCNASVDTTTVPASIKISPIVAGKFMYWSNRKNITFLPDSQLAANTTYTVSIYNSLKTSKGVSLEYSTSTSFLTGD